MQNDSSITSNIVSFIFVAIPAAIIFWQLFKKAGRPGWAGLIPVYNFIVMAEIAKRTKMMFVALAIYVVAIPTVFIASASLSSGTQNAHMGLGGLIALLITAPAFFTAGVLYLIILISFIKKYQASTAFWLGFIFLPLIAVFFTKNVSYIGEFAEDTSLPSAGTPYNSYQTTPQTTPMPPQYSDGPFQMQPSQGFVSPQVASPLAVGQPQPMPAQTPSEPVAPPQPPNVPPKV